MVPGAQGSSACDGRGPNCSAEGKHSSWCKKGEAFPPPFLKSVHFRKHVMGNLSLGL